MDDNKPKGLFQFLPYEQRKAAEADVGKRLTDLYDVADDLQIYVEELELLLNELHKGISRW